MATVDNLRDNRKSCRVARSRIDLSSITPLSYRACQAVDVGGPGYSGWQGDHNSSPVGIHGQIAIQFF